MPENVLMLWFIYIIGGYLLGGVMFCRIIPKWILKKDICELSPDHNPGAANAFMICGIPLGMLCLILDMLKGFLPVYSAARTLGTDDILFAAVMAAPVLGHATAPFDRSHGGKCIATSFGETLAVLPATNIGLILAGLYILFSTVLKINPHRKRSIAAFAVFGILAGIMLFYRRQYSIAAGIVSISCIAIVKHLKCFSHEEENVTDTTDAQKGER